MNRNLPITILGAGSWGTTFAIHADQLGYSVRLWEYFSENVAFMNKTRRNPLLGGIPIPKQILITNDLKEALEETHAVVLAVPSHTLRRLLENTGDAIQPRMYLVNLSKGIEENTLLRMSEVIRDVRGHPTERIITLHGPSHAEEVSRQVPTAVVAASQSLDSARYVQELFSSEYFRIYTSTDIIGVELGGAIKNVIAIASGICDGLGLGDNTKAALITRGLMEIIRMGVKMGAREETFAGLSGIGDLIVTCNSKHSRNRYVGEEIAKGRKLKDILDGMSMIAEGVRTCKTIYQLMERERILMPISRAVYQVLYQDKPSREALHELMTRDPVDEWHSVPNP